MNLFSALLITANYEEKELGFFWGRHRHWEGKNPLPNNVCLGIELWNSYQEQISSSPEFLQCSELFNPKLRKSSSHLINSLMEHFICKHWGLFSKQDLHTELKRFKILLKENKALTPYSLRKMTSWVLKTESETIVNRTSTIKGFHEILKLNTSYNQLMELALMDVIQNYQLFEEKMVELIVKYKDTVSAQVA